MHNPALETAMHKHYPQTATWLRGLFGAAALALTLGIVSGLDALSDRCSAATMAKAPAVVVVASR
jgi:hypothetical protein